MEHSSLATDRDEPMRNAKSVMIVEDVVSIAGLLDSIVTQSFAGTRVVTARNGLEALRLLRQGVPCDLMLCDLMMPEMDGATLIRHLAADSRLCLVPVLILSGIDGVRLKRLMELPNVRGMFRKPFDPSTFGTRLRPFMD